MSDRKLRRRIPSINTRKSTPSSARSRHRRPPPPPIRAHHPPNPPKPPFRRSSSEPLLFTVRFASDDDPPHDAVLYRPQTCTDIFAPPSPLKSKGFYEEEAKVVVTVTVEGSPGPVRTMVRLGATVEETIRCVVGRYVEEGRSPRIDRVGSASDFDLHHSHFCLESLNKWAKIGEVGGRNFYLRRSSSNRSSLGARSEDEDTKTRNTSSSSLLVMKNPLFPSLIARKLRRFGRRARKFWKIINCIPCG
ncbi:Uncharacterized protein QJS10_CPA01g02649 [Acorus calamus]|uniref:DUF7054 domain-containing protein n=1 Tax=Acorus calamus TaxID=4465 RepID=A0AAV9FM49_ACOCL|nr:Uncharacterized protein QJS10_CPA01g02649 [Acorus calamus]